MDPSKGRGTFRGRGFGPAVTLPQPLRRPGGFESSTSASSAAPVNDVGKSIDEMYAQLARMNIQDDGQELPKLVANLKALCVNVNALNSVVNCTYNFSMKTLRNACVGARVCKLFEDFEVKGTKFKPLMLRKIQQDFENRHKNRENPEKFVIYAMFICKIFLSLRLPDGRCFDFLVMPIIEYLSILLDGKTDLEIKVYTELLLLCYSDISSCEPSALDDLLMKMRRRIIEGTLSTNSRTKLLQTLENIIAPQT